MLITISGREYLQPTTKRMRAICKQKTRNALAGGAGHANTRETARRQWRNAYVCTRVVMSAGTHYTCRTPNVKSRMFMNFVKFPRGTAAVGIVVRFPRSCVLLLFLFFCPMLFLFRADPSSIHSRARNRRCPPPRKVFVQLSRQRRRQRMDEGLGTRTSGGEKKPLAEYEAVKHVIRFPSLCTIFFIIIILCIFHYLSFPREFVRWGIFHLLYSCRRDHAPYETLLPQYCDGTLTLPPPLHIIHAYWFREIFRVDRPFLPT